MSFDRATLFQLATELQRAGRLQEASSTCQQLLATEPSDAEALHLMAILSAQLGLIAQSEQFFRKAIDANPNVAAYPANLASLLAQPGRVAEAIELYRRALLLAPTIADLHNNLGNALKVADRLDEAMDAYRQALRYRPDFAEARNNLGVVLRQRRRLAEAIAEFRHAVRLQPDRAEMQINLAQALKEDGALEQAGAAARQAVALRPDLPAAHLAHAEVLLEQGDVESAIETYQRVRQLDPANAVGLIGIGSALKSKGDIGGAIKAFATSVTAHPDSIDACNNLGGALMQAWRLDEAVSCFRDGLARGLASPEVCGNLGNALKEQGELDEAIEAFDRGLAIRPDSRVASSRLYTLHHHPGYSPRRLLAEHVRWDQIYALPLRQQWRPHDHDPDPGRKLRIGYVGWNLGNHPVGRLLVPLFANHDRERFEVYCYCDLRGQDAVGDALYRTASAWRVTRGMSDEALADLIRKDRIDILVDLNMHTLGNRLLMFARKPAPVQATYLAYPGTTGLTAMDYRITDPYLDPPSISRDELYVEKSVRLPHSFWCYPAPPEAPPVNRLPALSSSNGPALATGHIQFGCLNSFAKVTLAVLAQWCELLGRVPDSTLLLHCPSEAARSRVSQL
ncbi:MAG TPA: tetratricopeptide repeat protein, partial [Tepidisphaeraceae bacterium]|nr:tetratricopeptide repeat protein [Tepidisphaeraceae bacterium]